MSDISKVAKILPLLNSDKPGEVDAAVAALQRHDLRDIAAALKRSPREILRGAFTDLDLFPDDTDRRRKRLNALKQKARELFGAQGLTKRQRTSLDIIIAIPEPTGWRDRITDSVLSRWEIRIHDIRWQLTPGAAAVEADYRAAATLTGAVHGPRDLANPETRKRMISDATKLCEALARLVERLKAIES